jgi:hypothetical protein
MHEIHLEFEKYYAEFLKKNSITKQELEKSSRGEFKSFKESVLSPQMPETDETGLVVIEQMSDEDKEAKKVFTKLYKDIVKKCHPDRLSQDDMDYFNKMNTKFKAASWAYNNAKWSILIRVASELNIKPMNYKKMNGHLRKEVIKIDKKLRNHKMSYGWKLYQAEEKTQKDNIIKEFIYRLFRRKM